jgi:hypothetical protein
LHMRGLYNQEQNNQYCEFKLFSQIFFEQYNLIQLHI